MHDILQGSTYWCVGCTACEHELLEQTRHIRRHHDRTLGNLQVSSAYEVRHAFVTSNTVADVKRVLLQAGQVGGSRHTLQPRHNWQTPNRPLFT